MKERARWILFVVELITGIAMLCAAVWLVGESTYWAYDMMGPANFTSLLVILLFGGILMILLASVIAMRSD